MEIVVCIKQVPDTTEIKINPVTGTLIRDGSHHHGTSPSRFGIA